MYKKVNLYYTGMTGFLQGKGQKGAKQKFLSKDSNNFLLRREQKIRGKSNLPVIIKGLK